MNYIEVQKAAICIQHMQQYNVVSAFDNQVKFTGLLVQCQRWIGDHGSQWAMHEVLPCFAVNQTEQRK